MSTEPPALPVGTRIRHYRKKRGRSQAAVAGLCGISERYFSMIEKGQRVPSPKVLARIASELGLPVADLVSEEQVAKAPSLGTAPEIARVLMSYTAPSSGEAVGPVELRERVESAWGVWQSSPERFTAIERVLPSLITDTEYSARAHRGNTDTAARREVLRTAADLYGLVRSYCRRSGRLDLALMVADRARRAAEDADDPIRMAAAQWNLGHYLLSREGGASEAEEVARLAVEELEASSDSPDNAAMRGALELVRVVSEAQRKKWWSAREILAHRAAPLAERAGDSNVMWTVFGPTNVMLHALSIEMLAGQSADGLRLADEVDISGVPSRERKFTFTLELARCYDLRRDDAAVLVHLLGLEELSAEDVRRSAAAVDLVTRLLHRVRPTFRPQVADMAERLGIA
jgi:transcriptional regulator with XRE-family HTH domain